MQWTQFIVAITIWSLSTLPTPFLLKGVGQNQRITHGIISIRLAFELAGGWICDTNGPGP